MTPRVESGRRDGETSPPRTKVCPLWCRLRLHHQWHPAITEDGEHYRRCRACGMDDDETSRRRVAGSMLAAHGVTQY